MFYREAGQFKTTYASDQAIFTIRQDYWFVIALLVFAFVVPPLTGSQYLMGPILTQFLVFGLAALGLNLLTGYAGQISLGTGGFMAVGAYSCYNLVLRLPEIPPVLSFLIAGVITALVGIVFGLPSLRIKGFYLAVATLAAQFFLLWLFVKVPWFVNYSISGVPTAPPRSVLGFDVTGATATNEAKYLFVLAFVIVLAWIARNMARSRIGRSWMAIRDMDIAAELIGIRPLPTKLSAFAISSFYCGVAGALWAMCYINTVEPTAFDINRSFQVLFMVIVGGLGSVLGSFLGAAFIFLLPIFLNSVPSWFGYTVAGDTITHIEFMLFGALIIFFLIVEPHGLARLWQIAKEKLRLWPFPY
jgi:branched-chain amino acid transport system permease protein